jgi:hypothetical protein
LALFVSTALDEDVEQEAIRVNGALEPVLLAGDGDDDFIEMPIIATLRGAATGRSISPIRRCGAVRQAARNADKRSGGEC